MTVAGDLLGSGGVAIDVGGALSSVSVDGTITGSISAGNGIGLLSMGPYGSAGNPLAYSVQVGAGGIGTFETLVGGLYVGSFNITGDVGLIESAGAFITNSITVTDGNVGYDSGDNPLVDGGIVSATSFGQDVFNPTTGLYSTSVTLTNGSLANLLALDGSVWAEVTVSGDIIRVQASGDPAAGKGDIMGNYHSTGGMIGDESLESDALGGWGKDTRTGIIAAGDIGRQEWTEAGDLMNSVHASGAIRRIWAGTYPIPDPLDGIGDIYLDIVGDSLGELHAGNQLVYTLSLNQPLDSLTVYGDFGVYDPDNPSTFTTGSLTKLEVGGTCYTNIVVSGDADFVTIGHLMADLSIGGTVQEFEIAGSVGVENGEIRMITSGETYTYKVADYLTTDPDELKDIDLKDAPVTGNSAFEVQISIGNITESALFGDDIFADVTIGGSEPIPWMKVDGGIYGNFGVPGFEGVIQPTEIGVAPVGGVPAMMAGADGDAGTVDDAYYNTFTATGTIGSIETQTGGIYGQFNITGDVEKIESATGIDGDMTVTGNLGYDADTGNPHKDLGIIANGDIGNSVYDETAGSLLTTYRLNNVSTIRTDDGDISANFTLSGDLAWMRSEGSRVIGDIAVSGNVGSLDLLTAQDDGWPVPVPANPDGFFVGGIQADGDIGEFVAGDDLPRYTLTVGGDLVLLEAGLADDGAGDIAYNIVVAGGIGALNTYQDDDGVHYVKAPSWGIVAHDGNIISAVRGGTVYMIRAGMDAGADGLYGTGDDTPMTGLNAGNGNIGWEFTPNDPNSLDPAQITSTSGAIQAVTAAGSIQAVMTAQTDIGRWALAGEGSPYSGNSEADSVLFSKDDIAWGLIAEDDILGQYTSQDDFILALARGNIGKADEWLALEAGQPSYHSIDAGGSIYAIYAIGATGPDGMPVDGNIQATISAGDTIHYVLASADIRSAAEFSVPEVHWTADTEISAPTIHYIIANHSIVGSSTHGIIGATSHALGSGESYDYLDEGGAAQQVTVYRGRATVVEAFGTIAKIQGDGSALTVYSTDNIGVVRNVGNLSVYAGMRWQPDPEDPETLDAVLPSADPGEDKIWGTADDVFSSTGNVSGIYAVQSLRGTISNIGATSDVASLAALTKNIGNVTILDGKLGLNIGGEQISYAGQDHPEGIYADGNISKIQVLNAGGADTSTPSLRYPLIAADIAAGKSIRSVLTTGFGSYAGIEAETNIGTVQAIIGHPFGGYPAELTAGKNISKVIVGALKGKEVFASSEGYVNVTAANNIGSIYVTGNYYGSVDAGRSITRVESLSGSIISPSIKAGRDIGTIRSFGSILGGYEGFDYNPIHIEAGRNIKNITWLENFEGAAHAGKNISKVTGGTLISNNVGGLLPPGLSADGNIGTVTISGVEDGVIAAKGKISKVILTDTTTDGLVISAGFAPGADGVYGTVDDTDTGVGRRGSIGTVSARGGSIADAVIQATGKIGTVSAFDSIIGSTITAGFDLADNGADTTDVTYDKASISKVTTEFGNITGSVIGAAGKISKIQAGGGLDSTVSAGYNPVDEVFGNGDDSLAGIGKLADIRSITAGDNGIFLGLDTGEDHMIRASGKLGNILSDGGIGQVANADQILAGSKISKIQATDSIFAEIHAGEIGKGVISKIYAIDSADGEASVLGDVDAMQSGVSGRGVIKLIAIDRDESYAVFNADGHVKTDPSVFYYDYSGEKIKQRL
ncbi:MAG: hypothetical protein ACTSWM_08025 [Alphaproteobacteria bacterium]